ncbi:50S ribosomal protein L21 [Candidatus Roizmanbacteria bacterium]|nr:50S ribosomal protein L21 [Candidatus Roizmanbacteria bacterium]
MARYAVIKTGGKQYLVQEKDEIVVDKLANGKTKTVELETLAHFDTDKISVILGAPILKEKTKVQIIENLKGDKIRVARFKAKVRYRRVKGFRPQLSKIKILKI